MNGLAGRCMDRRTFLAGTVAVPAAAAVTELITREAAQAAAPGYVVNRAPLRPDAFIRLAPGQTRATGWLATQLGYQLDGINGRMTEISHFLQYDNTGWIRPNLGGWEERPLEPVPRITGEPRHCLLLLRLPSRT